MGKSQKVTRYVTRYISCLAITLIILNILSTTTLAGNGVGTGNDAKNGKFLETLQKKGIVRNPELLQLKTG